MWPGAACGGVAALWGVVVAVDGQWRWRCGAVAGGSDRENGDGEVVDGAPKKIDELRQPATARRGGVCRAAVVRAG